MANQITGRIIEIGQTVQIPSKNGGSSFTKREFILDGANETIEEYKNKVIDEQIEAIKGVAPDIVIIEV